MPRQKKSYNANEWWTLVDNVKDEELASAIHAKASAIESDQSSLHTQYLSHLQLYLNRNVSSLANPTGTMAGVFERNMTLNVCGMAIDSICAKIAKNKVRVYYLPHDGDPDQQERAVKMSAYMDHVFEAQRFYDKAQEAFRHMCIFGSGALQIAERDGEIVVEPVFIWDLRIDETEAINGQPEQLHHVKMLTKSKLKALYPDSRMAIDQAPFASDDNGQSTKVKVIESWHLPSKKGADDGHRVVSIENGVLESAPYPYMHFPFVFAHYTKPVVGFWGIGVTEAVKGLQYKLNDVEDRIEESMKFSIPRVFLDTNTEVDETELNDLVGAIVRYSGPSAPQIGTPQTVSGETFQYRNDLYQKVFEVIGVSMLSVAGKKDPSLESGAAIAEFMDIESERFALTGLVWEQLFLEGADIIMEFSRALFSKKKIKLRTNDGQLLDSAFWGDIELPEESVELAKFATPVLPKTPAGQIQTVINLNQGGVTTPEEAKALLRLPDTGAFFRQTTSPYRLCQKVIQNILVHGKTYNPEHLFLTPEMLQMLGQIGLARLLDAQVNDTAEPANIHNLQDFLLQLKDMTEPPPEEMAPPMMDQGLPPDPGLMPPMDQAPMMDPNAQAPQPTIPAEAMAPPQG